MNTLNLTLLVPFPSSALQPSTLMLMPSLRYLMKHAKKKPLGPLDEQNIIASSLDHEHRKQLPIAALEALSYGLPAEEGWWMRADPVELNVDAGYIHFLGGNHLELTESETTQLLSELNEFLADENMHLYALGQQWYLHTHEPPQIITHTPLSAYGHDIRAYLPQGPGAKRWRALLTALQMILHTSVVNRRRAEEKRPLVSSVWFWGQGALPHRVNPAKDMSIRDWKMVFSNDALVKGLAKLNDKSFNKLPETFETFLPSLSKPGDYLATLHVSAAQIFEPEQLERQWFAPLLSVLRAGQIEQLILLLGDGFRYEINVKQARTWWHRVRHGLKVLSR